MHPSACFLTKAIQITIKIRLIRWYFENGIQKNSDLRKYPTYEIRHTRRNLYSIYCRRTGTVHLCPSYKISDLSESDLRKFDCTYPLPHIKDVIDKMAGAWYWTTLDAASAYWSIPLAENDKEKTAFSAPHGKYEFNVTLYGLSNADSSYQRMMLCLSGLTTERILAYMDDIVIFNSTFQEHLKDISAVFDRLRLANVTLKGSKCVFASESVDFLGFELSCQGIKPQHRLIETINQFPPPQSRKELKRFWGYRGSIGVLFQIMQE